MKKRRTWSAAGSKGLKSGKTRERGYFASSQVNKIFILLTCISKFIAALPGGSFGAQGSFQRRTICASLLFSMVGLFFLSYHGPEGPVNGKPRVALWRQNCSSGPDGVCWRRPPECSDTPPTAAAARAVLVPMVPCFRAGPHFKQLSPVACPVNFCALPFPSRENLL